MTRAGFLKTFAVKDSWSRHEVCSLKTETRHKIFRKMAARCQPVRVQMEFTRACNLDCVHCMVRHGREDTARQLSADEIKDLLGQFRSAGVIHLNVTGGEPFLRPDAADILQAVFDTGFMLTLQTNGTRLTPAHVSLLQRNAKRVRQAGLSLYAMNPDTHDAVTRTPGSHVRTLGAIRALRAAGLPVVAVMPITTINESEFPAVERFCADNGLMFQYNTLIVPRDDGGRTPLDYRLDAAALCRLPRPWETFMDDYNPTSPGDLDAGKSIEAWCSMGSSSCYITADGIVRPCSMVNEPAGSIREQPFGQIWRDSEIFQRIRAFRLEDFECFHCARFPRCHPCPGLAFLEHGSFTAPAREICRINDVFMDGDSCAEKSVHSAGSHKIRHA